MEYVSMTNNFHHLKPHTWQKNLSQALVPQQWRRSDAAENLKVKWAVLYGIEVSTPYEIYEGTLATYVFVYPSNNKG